MEGFGDVLDTDQDTDADDLDGANDPVDNRIPVVLDANEVDEGNNFVNRVLINRISGFVRLDDDGDNILEEPIEGATIELWSGSGVFQARTQTNESGFYQFDDEIDPGTYFLFEDPSDEYEDLFDRDESISEFDPCLLYTSPSPRDATLSRMPSSA